MYENLNPADRPVIDGLEEHEIVYAKDQPQYIPLRTLRSNTPEARVMSRWSLTPEQRNAIAAGADVFLTLLTFGQPLQPIMMAVSDKPNPDYFREVFRLEPELKWTLYFVVYGHRVKVDCNPNRAFEWWVSQALTESGYGHLRPEQLELRDSYGSLVPQWKCPYTDYPCEDGDTFYVSLPAGYGG